MHAGRRQSIGKPNAARHAQVDQQHALVHVKQKVFATSTHRNNPSPHQVLRLYLQRPTQWLAQLHGLNRATHNAAGNTLARNFNFWQFGHIRQANR